MSATRNTGREAGEAAPEKRKGLPTEALPSSTDNQPNDSILPGASQGVKATGAGATPAEWHAYESIFGMRDLLPVVADPDAPISPRSQVKRFGKIPSCFNRRGQAFGLKDWTSIETTASKIKEWSKDGRLGICLQTRRFRAIDVDITDPALAAEVLEDITLMLGNLPTRTRADSCKFLMLVDCPGELHKRVIKCEHGIIELLGNGQQCVIASTHPDGQQYDWKGSLAHGVPVVSIDELDTLWQLLAAAVGLPGGSSTDSGAVALERPRRAADALADPIVDYLLANDLVIQQRPDGKMFVECPQKHLHSTDNGPSETVWLPAGVGGREVGGFECRHRTHGRITTSVFLDLNGYGSGARAEDFDPVESGEEAAEPFIQQPDGSRKDMTDKGNVSVLAQLTGGDLRYVGALKLWLFWDGSRWVRDEDQGRLQLCLARVAEYWLGRAKRELAKAEDLSEDAAKASKKAAALIRAWGMRCRSRPALEAMRRQAETDIRFLLDASQLDQDANLLGAENGVVDLRTGKLRQAGRDEFVTLRVPDDYDPSAACEGFERFVAEITGEPTTIDPTTGKLHFRTRPEVASYLQKQIGYCATGLTHEHKMFCYIGQGSNGKSALADMVARVFGPDYQVPIPPSVLMASSKDTDGERATPFARNLEHKRLAIGGESSKRQELNSTWVKQQTGDTRVAVRGLFEAARDVRITHKLLLLTNHAPAVDHLDEATRQRIHVLGFERRWNRPGYAQDPTLPDADKGLPERLLAEESAGILRWIVEGAVRYYREGLEPPVAVVASTQGYFHEQDPMARWLETVLRCDPKAGALSSALYEQFQTWCDAQEVEWSSVPTSTAFGRELGAKGYASERTMAGRKWGISTCGGFA